MSVQDMVKVERAIISVHDKKNVQQLGKVLKQVNAGVEIYSSGGTAAELRKAVMMNVKDIADYTKVPEMPGGLVKTMHPKVHAGILAEHGDGEQEAYLQVHGIRKFDLVVVNLYPFAQVAENKSAKVEDARRNMDIGGVALIEAAAKNFLRVAVVVDPADYASLAAALKKNSGSVDLKTRIRLAKKALKYLSGYLGSMSRYYDGLSDDSIAAQYGVVRHEWKERLQERLQ